MGVWALPRPCSDGEVGKEVGEKSLMLVVCMSI